MKVVIIHGQNHMGSTYHLGRTFLEKLPGENEVKEFFLPRDLNHFCLGCYSCLDGDEKCPFYKDKRVITEAMEEADLLVFTTPNYCLGPTASMKAFIDLTFTYWFPHRPRESMFSKKAVVISTTAGAGAGKATKFIAKTLDYWGVPYIKRYGLGVQAMNWQGVADKKKAKIEKDLTKLAAKVSAKKNPKPSIRQKMTFNMLGLMQKGNMGSSPYEKEYWTKLGWLDKKRPWKK